MLSLLGISLLMLAVTIMNHLHNREDYILNYTGMFLSGMNFAIYMVTPS